MAALAALDGFRDFAHCCLGTGGIDGEFQKVAFSTGGGGGDGIELGIDFRLVAVGLEARELIELHAAHRGIVDLQHRHVLILVEQELVDANHGLFAAVDAGLRAGRCFLDAKLRDAFLDGLAHAPEFLDLVDMLQRLGGKIVGQALDIVGAAPGVDGLAGAAFLLQEELRIARDTRGEIRRQGQRFVEAVGVQRLGLPADRRDGFKAGADDIVVDVLRRQRPAGGLRVGAQ